MSGPPPSSQLLPSLEATLASAFVPYVDRNRVTADVRALISNSNSLVYRIGQYVPPNGPRETLLQLNGTIPIWYKGSCYNIPLVIWVPLQYPNRPPIPYVTPTQDMRIKDGHKHVDHLGMIYLPYLHHWSARTSNLLEMVTIISSVFSTDPPVFRVPSGQSANTQTQQQQQYQQSPNSYYSASPQQHPPPRQQTPPVDPEVTRRQELISQLTSKLRAQLQDELSLKAMLTEDLVAQETQIQQHAKEIDAKLQQMRSQIQTFQQVKQQLQAKNDEIRTWLQQNETRAITVEDADRLCYPKDTWSKQLLECVSLDYAIDDAYYVLDRCLANEKIDLRTYTKQIRNLAHQQFYARALLQRIQKQQQQQQGNNSNLMSMPMPMPMPAVGAVPSYPAGYPL